MSKQEINLSWMENMAFEANVSGHKIVLDAGEQVGGENRGARPKPLMMVALAGCTAMDVISILRKMKVIPEYFNVKVEGDISEDHPKQFTVMHVIYEFKGKDLPMDKLEKAVGLSEKKYCGVSASYRKAFPITSEIKILK